MPEDVRAATGSASLSSNPPVSTTAMPHRTVGFMLSHEQFTVPQLVQLAAQAESAGLDPLVTSDHFQPWQANECHSGAAWVTLGALSQRVQKAWMGPTVTCPTLRYHPAIVAQAYATIGALAPGRIFLGLGSGEALNEQAATGEWPNWRERWDRLIEALGLIRELWSGRPVEHAGKHYQVRGRLYDPPPQPIPLLTAANGPNAMRLAGEHGDGLITDAQTWKEHKDVWQSAARKAGKNPDEMPVLVEQFVVVGDDAEAREAAKLWRFIPKAFKGYHDIPDPVRIQQRAERELSFEKVVESWSVGTDPAVHARIITELFDSGATIVNIHAGQRSQREVIDFYGRQVLPSLNSQRTAQVSRTRH